MEGIHHPGRRGNGRIPPDAHDPASRACSGCGGELRVRRDRRLPGRQGAARGPAGQRRRDCFRDACAQPGLPLTEVAQAVDESVTRAAGEEDFVTAVFAELDPAGWIQLVICGHPPPLRLSTDGQLVPLAPRAFTAPLGLHPDLHPSTFSVRTGDRLLFFIDELLEARDRAGRFFPGGPADPDAEPTRPASSRRRTAGPGARTPGVAPTTTSPCCWPSSPSRTQHSSLSHQARGLAQARQ